MTAQVVLLCNPSRDRSCAANCSGRFSTRISGDITGTLPRFPGVSVVRGQIVTSLAGDDLICDSGGQELLNFGIGADRFIRATMRESAVANTPCDPVQDF